MFVGECVRWLNDHDQLWVHNITVLTIYTLIQSKYNIARSPQGVPWLQYKLSQNPHLGQPQVAH